MTRVLWKLAERTIARYVPPERLAAILGDVAEEYAEQLTTQGRLRAGVWLMREARSLSHAYAEQRSGGPEGRIAFRDELAHAWRALRRRPVTPLACAALLALAAGLVTGMITVIDSLVWHPVPFPAAERLVEQRFWRPEPDVLAAWKASGLFEEVGAGGEFHATLESVPDRTMVGAAVTPGLLGMLGAEVDIGRSFSPRASDEIILSETVWRSMFGADSALVGRRIRLEGESLQVVGIMPSTFRFPTPSTVVWRPMDLASWPRSATIYGRKKPHVAWAEIAGRLESIAAHHAYIPRNYSGTPPFARVATSPLSEHTRQALWLLMAGVALVFLVVAANVVILLLSRLGQRQLELATCAALGASRARLLRQVILEHTLLSVAGVAASIGIASMVAALLPSQFVGRTLNVVDLDQRAWIAAVIVSIITVSVAGVVPAWVGMRHDPANALRRMGASGTTLFSRVTTHGLLVTQIALAAALLIASTVLMRSFINLMLTDRGLDVEGVVRARITNVDDAFPSIAGRATALATLREDIRQWPEVIGSALSREIPPLSYGAGGEAHVQDLDGYRVNPEFFSIYGITILSGRVFRGDADAGEIILGERLARTLPEGNAVGRIFRRPGMRPREVVGVAREITLPALDPELDRPEFYLPMGAESRTLYLNLRCSPACPSADAMTDRVRRIHPVLRASIVQPGEMPFARQLELPSAIAQVSSTFALVALFTTACGLYSVLTFVAQRRRREFGIRQMLGASPRDIRQLVLRQGCLVVTSGTLIGAVGGWILSRSLSAFLYGVVLLDPMTWAVPLILLAIASVGAMWLPCRIAAHANPIMLVREE